MTPFFFTALPIWQDQITQLADGCKAIGWGSRPADLTSLATARVKNG